MSENFLAKSWYKVSGRKKNIEEGTEQVVCLK
jgi:hypothetical protein